MNKIVKSDSIFDTNDEHLPAQDNEQYTVDNKMPSNIRKRTGFIGNLRETNEK